MTAWALRFGSPVLIVLGVAAYYLWPAQPAWSVFRMSAVEEGQATWVMDGLLSREECETTARQLARLSREDAGFACGDDCRFLGGRPDARYCEEMGEPHESG